MYIYPPGAWTCIFTPRAVLMLIDEFPQLRLFPFSALSGADRDRESALGNCRSIAAISKMMEKFFRELFLISLPLKME